MAKRFTATEIWEEDWFLEMPNEYKLFWYYMLSKCDHAGVYRVNVKKFILSIEQTITSSKALELFNNGKNRIRVLSESKWFIEDFFVFQYGKTMNLNSKMHESIQKVYNQEDIKLTSIRGLSDLKDRVKDKEKDKEKDIITKENKNKKIEKEVFGKEFTQDHNYVILTNGQLQELGENQKIQLQYNSLNPKDVYKNYIQ